MAKQERARVTRERVLRAAGQVFAESGYHRASVGEIIERSGMTKGALYFHFRSKREMAEGVMAQLRDLDSIPEYDGPVRLQTLITLFNGYAAPPATDPILNGALRLADEPEFEGGEWHERLQLTITGLLTEAARSGELLSHVEPAQTAELLTTILAGLRRYTPTSPSRVGKADRITTMWCHLLPAIAVPALIPSLEFRLRPPAAAIPEDHHRENLLEPSGGAPSSNMG